MFKKNYKYKKENYEFWLSRCSNSERKVCTNDIYLDLIEEDQIIKNIRNNKTILEIGSGNGILLKRLLKKKKIKKYLGTDFVEELVKKSKKYFKKKNIDFKHFDMTLISNKSFDEKFDYIISKRAVQNVLSRKLQIDTIDKFGYHLKKSGQMILVESSITAQRNINFFRKKYKLPKIFPPFHNLFFDDKIILNHNFKNVKLKKISNFSSNYYFISRILNALLCKDHLKKKVSYNDPLNQIALSINEDLLKKDFSQIKTYFFVRK